MFEYIVLHLQIFFTQNSHTQHTMWENTGNMFQLIKPY